MTIRKVCPLLTAYFPIIDETPSRSVYAAVPNNGVDKSNFSELASTTVTHGVRRQHPRTRPGFRLWVMPLAGLVTGFALSLAVVPSGRMALAAAASAWLLSRVAPWTRRRRRLDRVHRAVLAARPLRTAETR